MPKQSAPLTAPAAGPSGLAFLPTFVNGRAFGSPRDVAAVPIEEIPDGTPAGPGGEDEEMVAVEDVVAVIPVLLRAAPAGTGCGCSILGARILENVAPDEG